MRLFQIMSQFTCKPFYPYDIVSLSSDRWEEHGLKYCPKCTAEYREGFEKCADCGTALVDQLPSQASADIASLEDLHSENTELVLLTQVPGDQECMFTRSLLESYGIPSLYQYTRLSDISHLYGGVSLFGINIYVRKDQFELASEILNAPIDVDTLPEQEEDTQ